ncbi:MAG TPA: zinc-ribbon domain-containing protein [Verrucomicrobiae bacterium]|nr:zinc-ribbon domain-containing protein [Verrucomicrobiae bacterium]
MAGDGFICPNCGAEVPAKAKACPECGADEQTGWSDNTIYDGTDIEDPGEFNYEEWKRREVEGRPPRRTRKQWFWWAVAIAVLIALVWLFVMRQWCALP